MSSNLIQMEHGQNQQVVKVPLGFNVGVAVQMVTDQMLVAAVAAILLLLFHLAIWQALYPLPLVALVALHLFLSLQDMGHSIQ
jgi:hypothetical protein